jgi:hypothetical protein
MSRFVLIFIKIIIIVSAILIIYPGPRSVGHQLLPSDLLPSHGGGSIETMAQKGRGWSKRYDATSKTSAVDRLQTTAVAQAVAGTVGSE